MSPSLPDGVVAQLVEHHNGILLVNSMIPTINLPPIVSSSSLFISMPMKICMGAEATAGVALGQAITSLIAAKRLANLRPKYVKSLEQFLKLFAKGREDIPIASLDVVAVETWLANRPDKATTRQGNVGRLGSLFAFAKRRRWITENPCDQLERIRIEVPPPRILSPQEAESLMRWAQFEKPKSVGYFAKGLFVGIRPEECERLALEKIDEANGIVTIDSTVSKVRHRRIIELHPTAREWLAEARRLGCLGPVSHATRRRWLKSARKHMGWEGWPQDILRHSCASYLMAHHRNAGLVADWLGNSVTILLRHYRELVTAQDAETFWKIRP